MSQIFNLDSYGHSVRQQVESQLSQILNCPGNQIQNLHDAMSYAVLAGGKRVRPLLCFASAQLFDQDSLSNPAVLSAACSVELIHAYSLIHDDLPAMDDDDLRRGRPTVHKQFDEATAILAGDGLQTLAFESLSKTQNLPAESILESIRLLAEASGSHGMVGGQMLDLNEVGNNISIDALVNMHSMKTGALIRASVIIGALTSGCRNPSHLKGLENYAEKIGLAFQIQDDILDQTSSTEVLGKQQGADAELGKPTYVSLLGIDGARTKLKHAHEQALTALHKVEKDIYADQNNQEKSLLEQIADYIVSRNN